MKKYILSLLLLILMFTLSGCQFFMFKNSLTEVKANEFYVFLGKVSNPNSIISNSQFKFKYEYLEESYYKYGEASNKITFEGRYKDDDSSVGLSYKGTQKRVYYKTVNKNVVQFNETIKENGVIQNKTSKDFKGYYATTYKLKSDVENKSFKTKSTNNDNRYMYDVFSEMIAKVAETSNLFVANKTKYYVSGKKGTMICSTLDREIEMIYIIDGNQVDGIKIKYQDGYKKYSLEFIFKEVKDIKKPWNSSSYTD